MWVLGIADMFHDSAACLVKDGQIVVAIEEERLSRVKHDESFPNRSIRYCLKAAGITMKDIDLIVRTSKIMSSQQRSTNKTPEIYIRHHLAHAASTFLVSGFKDAAIMVLDGGGSFGYLSDVLNEDNGRERQTFWRGLGNDILNISTWGSKENNFSPYPRSVGQIYELATEILGFDPIFDAGKTMGLSSYGSGLMKRDINKSYRFLDDGHVFGLMHDASEWEHLRRRNKEDPITDEHAELAFMVQYEMEECIMRMAKHLKQISGSANICLAGGVALNSVVNTRILKECGFSDVFIQPASGDSGLAIGAAMWGANTFPKVNPETTMAHTYLGFIYKNNDIKKALVKFENIEYKELSEAEVVLETAKYIEQGKIIGWFYGGSEFGPRSLGHRSILADPRKPEMILHLNKNVKRRESFRPFAPAILLEESNKFFELDYPSPFMLLVAPVLEEQRDKIPAVTHVDGTARVQTLTEKDNGRFYKLVRCFGELTGVPVILNTSFNVAGEPIVETPSDALRTFLSTNIDVLVLENFIVHKINNKKLH